MKILITDIPYGRDEQFVISRLWQHNSQFESVDTTPFFLTLRDDENRIAGGLVAET